MRAFGPRSNPSRPGSPDPMYQPAIPLSGLAGWKFLQSTYTRQLDNFADSASVKNDRAYMSEKLSKPISLDDFMADKRLLRVTMTAFDLGGEEWKGGFIRKVLEEAATPDSTFLKRLNNPDYTRYSQTFRFEDGMLSLDADQIETLGDNFETASPSAMSMRACGLASTISRRSSISPGRAPAMRQSVTVCWPVCPCGPFWKGP